ncbi:type II toxin-antitoxin system RelE/ParE family toxin [Burkholderia multivorans]|nr:type II toxin-antitoxin system RelE/ParE family toxin [Burkholderia multivorans]
MVEPVSRVLSVHFFRTESGNEPVREWLRGLDVQDRKAIGDDIKTVEIGWPLGMPLVRKMEADLWEVRVDLYQRVARVLFTVVGDKMVLLHGFIKKSQETPQSDLKLARARLRQLRDSAGTEQLKESHHGKQAHRK